MGDERPITLAQAARHYPDGTHLSTIVRHITRGIKTPRGVVRLEASQIGGRWATTAAAIERFRVACTETRGESPTPPVPRPLAQARAAAYLGSIGLR